MSWVVDASVVAAWLFQETHSPAAERIMLAGAILAAPDLIYAEVGNVAWKKVQRNEISQATATTAIDRLLALPLRIQATATLLPLALCLASELGRSVYDSLYLANAQLEEIPLVTADLRFYNALAGTPLRRHVVWVGDIRGEMKGT